MAAEGYFPGRNNEIQPYKSTIIPDYKGRLKGPSSIHRTICVRTMRGKETAKYAKHANGRVAQDDSIESARSEWH
jgi:hypothetical protein